MCPKQSLFRVGICFEIGLILTHIGWGVKEALYVDDLLFMYPFVIKFALVDDTSMKSQWIVYVLVETSLDPILYDGLHSY